MKKKSRKVEPGLIYTRSMTERVIRLTARARRSDRCDNPHCRTPGGRGRIHTQVFGGPESVVRAWLAAVVDPLKAEGRPDLPVAMIVPPGIDVALLCEACASAKLAEFARDPTVTFTRSDGA